MYHHVRGDLRELTPASAVVEAGGIGFDVRIPLSTFERLRGQTQACLFTHYHVREDEHRIYGFATKAERDLFRLLISVTGVGPTIAVQALSALSPADVAGAICQGDLKVLQKVKGVGKKLAERLVIELRDRVGGLLVVLGASQTLIDASLLATPLRDPLLGQPAASDAVLALVSLGFDRKQAEDRVTARLRSLNAAGESRLDAETLIKDCLRSE